MANTDNPFGFKPWGPILSAKVHKTDSSTSAIYKWDRVEDDGDGGIGPAEAGDEQQIGSAAHHVAVSTAQDVLVYDNPHQLFEAQDDAAGTSAATNIGNNTDHLATTGSTVTKISAHELKGNGYGTALAGFCIVDLVNSPGNAWGANARQVCFAQEHLYGQSLGRVTV